MGKLEKDKDGNLVIVVSYHIRHLGPRQSIVLECGRYTTVLELARALKLDRSYVARTLSLVNLAPDIVTAVMSGKASESVTLTKVLYGFPDNWQTQRKLLGIA